MIGHIHQLVSGLPPGGALRYSEICLTVFAADEMLHVLSGGLVTASPERGAVPRVQLGQRAEVRHQGGNRSLSVQPGKLSVQVSGQPSPSRHERVGGAGFNLRQGTRYRPSNMTAKPAELIIRVAPTHLPIGQA